MIYDKRVGYVGYNDELHKYVDIRDKSEYVSVTTLVGMYKEKFDQAYWSRYKALEAIVPGFKELKRQYSDSFMEIAEAMADPRMLEKEIARILAEWKNKRVKAARHGTKFHKAKEDAIKGKRYLKVGNKEFKVATTHYLKELENGIYPELLVASDEWNVAGQVDYCAKEGNEVDIVDYKTNKELKFENKFQKMLYPLDSLDDCNMNHYYLQLNLYAFLIEEQGLRVRSMVIEHSRTGKSHVVPRMQDVILKMLRHAKDSGRLVPRIHTGP